ncbi:transcriptional adapter 2-alpha [Anaeramoeba flamelloides]|uniref:Transcriptional adapter 2-alpha n=1 Tax=Anaeramoeba flamelloides TaxID=1746091 RepID=A0AAV8ABY3_9EUKA|nr:transcriptional adapter 2-alpha [Anaeramoeba flamelloides]
MRWSLKDEVLLLEAIDKCGLGNWSKIARIVHTKTKLQCKLHFERVYIQSKIFPYPSNKTILGAIRRFGKKKNCHERLQPTAESTPTTTPTLTTGSGSNTTATATPATTTEKGNTESLSINQNDLHKKQHKIQELRRSPIKRKYKNKLNQKKLRNKTVGEILGFLPKRYEFDVEYDDNCEEMINSLGFIDKSLSWELKLNVLQAFNKKIEEREKRKAFVVKMNLIETPFTKNNLIDQISGELLNEKNGLKKIKKNQKSNKFNEKNKQTKKSNDNGYGARENNNKEKSIGNINNNKNGTNLKPKTKEELEFLSKIKTFARCFNSFDEYENLKNKLLKEFRIKSQIQQLVNWSNNGIKSISEGLKFEKLLKKKDDFKKKQLIEQKRKRKRTNKTVKRGIKINNRKKNENKKNNISKKLFNDLNNNKNNNDNDNDYNDNNNNDNDDYNNGNNNFLNTNLNIQSLNVDKQLLRGDTNVLLTEIALSTPPTSSLLSPTLILPPSKTTIASTPPQNNNNDINCFQNRIPNENLELKIQLDQNKILNINKNPINNLNSVPMDIESNENSFFSNENK